MNVVELAKSQVNEAADVLARAFLPDANFAALHRDPGRRARALPHVFRAAVGAALPSGSALAAVEEGQILGVALWLPPGRSPVKAALQPRALLESVRAFAADPASIGPQLRFARAALPLHPAAPHWYLEALGVDEAHRRRGAGSRLVSAGLQRADQARVGAYLETSTERNAALYTRHGFETLRQDVRLTADGPPFWLMWRLPGGGIAG